MVREGEEERFEPFAHDPNRQLLWHGSLLSNFVGILSQGLRIAPPEAPVTGYMFDKGAVPCFARFTLRFGVQPPVSPPCSGGVGFWMRLILVAARAEFLADPQ